MNNTVVRKDLYNECYARCTLPAASCRLIIVLYFIIDLRCAYFVHATIISPLAFYTYVNIDYKVIYVQ